MENICLKCAKPLRWGQWGPPEQHLEIRPVPWSICICHTQAGKGKHDLPFVCGRHTSPKAELELLKPPQGLSF